MPERTADPDAGRAAHFPWRPLSTDTSQRNVPRKHWILVERQGSPLDLSCDLPLTSILVILELAFPGNPDPSN